MGATSILAGTADPAPLEQVALSGATMGTRYAAIFCAPEGWDPAPVQSALQSAVDCVDAQMSPWKPGSALMRFNRQPVGEWFDLPPETFEVLSEAISVAQYSDGAFNPFVGDLVSAWGFGASGETPDATARMDAAQNWRAARPEVEVDPNGKRLRWRTRHGLDFCGIAKGYGVDLMSRALQRAEFGDHLVSIDGEVRASGRRLDGRAWTVAIEKPGRRSRDPAFVIELGDLSIATSGSYRHSHEADGRLVSHTIDPATGAPLEAGFSAVSVLGDSCMTADAWATALMVMGPDRGPGFAAEHGLSALFATGEDAQTRYTGTGGFAGFSGS